jgi:hypothetical protein
MEVPMVKELSYEGKAAAGYDGAFAQVTTHFAPFLLRAAHITPPAMAEKARARLGQARNASVTSVSGFHLISLHCPFMRTCEPGNRTYHWPQAPHRSSSERDFC